MWINMWVAGKLHDPSLTHANLSALEMSIIHTIKLYTNVLITPHKHQQHHHPFDGLRQVNLGQPAPTQYSYSNCSRRERLGISDTGFLTYLVFALFSIISCVFILSVVMCVVFLYLFVEICRFFLLFIFAIYINANYYKNIN